MLPPHAPPEYADRNTLWNSAEAQEKQWNSQLARRFVLAIPREIPPEQYADLLRDYCWEFFVSKGMISVHSQKRGRLFLPFVDEDPKTAEIMSKIVLLAEDGKIKDPSILGQM